MILYWSGTGNSYQVARWLGEGLGVVEAPVPLRKEEILSLEHPPRAIVFPPHGFTAPWWVIRNALRLPPGKGAPIAIVPVRGGTKFGRLFLPGMSGTAGWVIALIVLLKGYAIRAVFPVDMPANWLSLHPGFCTENARAMQERAAPRVRMLAERLRAGRRAFSLGGFVDLAIGLPLVKISFMYLIFFRPFMTKWYFADSRCTSCGTCARLCPCAAIRMRGAKGEQRPYWTYDCESCMRCFSVCPERSVQAGYLWIFLLISLTSFPLWKVLLRPWIGGWVDGVAGFWLGWLYALVAWAACYAVFWQLTRVRWINRIFEFTTPTRWYRRYRAPDVRVEKDLRGSA